MLSKSSGKRMDYPRVLHLGCPYYIGKNCNTTNYDISSSSSPPSLTNTPNGPPRLGTTIPNRIFVGGLSSDTTEAELQSLFANYGNVTAVKIINDKSGVPKGYGFVTFETEEEARRVLKEADNLQLRGRKLNVAIAIKKQPVRLDGVSLVANGPLVYPPNSIPFTAFVNEAGPNYGFTGEGLYPLTLPPSASSLGSTYPIIYPQPIYFAQQAPMPHPCPYPKLDAMQTHHPATHLQGSVPTSSYQPSIPYPSAVNAAAAAYLASANGNPGNNAAGPWRWPPVNECGIPIVNVNSLVGLNK